MLLNSRVTEMIQKMYIKKELIVFTGLPQTLQIRPLPYEMMIEGVIEEEHLTSTINFRVYFMDIKELHILN
jgi:hypothetical protein